MARQHALTDNVATLIIVRIVVVIGIGGKANSDKRTPMKAVMKPMEATTVERKTVEATAVEATTSVETTAAVETAATTAVTAATAMTAAAAMSQCNAWLNQADRCRRQQSQYQFPRHASLLQCPRPRVWDTDATGLFGDEEACAIN
jgi:hypothetical protein